MPNRIRTYGEPGPGQETGGAVRQRQRPCLRSDAGARAPEIGNRGATVFASRGIAAARGVDASARTPAASSAIGSSEYASAEADDLGAGAAPAAATDGTGARAAQPGGRSVYGPEVRRRASHPGASRGLGWTQQRSAGFPRFGEIGQGTGDGAAPGSASRGGRAARRRSGRGAERGWRDIQDRSARH